MSFLTHIFDTVANSWVMVPLQLVILCALIEFIDKIASKK